MKVIVLPAKFINSLHHPIAKAHSITRTELKNMEIGRMTMLYANHNGGTFRERWSPNDSWEGTAILQPIAYDEEIAKINQKNITPITNEDNLK